VAHQHVATLPNIVTHAPIDVTGLLHHVSEPSRIDPDLLVDLVGRVDVSSSPFGAGEFDLVVSTGLLTQIFSTVVDRGLDPTSLARLTVALRAQHLRLMSCLTKPGGACLLVTELVSSTTVPGLVAMREEELRTCVPRLLASRNFFTGTHPGAIVQALSIEPSANCRPPWVAAIPPWLWRLGETRAYLAFAVAWGSRPATQRG
jgi:hypothetical protein